MEHLKSWTFSHEKWHASRRLCEEDSKGEMDNCAAGITSGKVEVRPT